MNIVAVNSILTWLTDVYTNIIEHMVSSVIVVVTIIAIILTLKLILIILDFFMYGGH